MAKDDKPKLDEKELLDQADKDPKSKKWNNPNSRKNLKQYQKEPEAALVPQVEVLDEGEQEAQKQAEAITVGRKLDTRLVRKLIPQRGVLTLAENKRFTDIVTSFLSDFKNEEPTASDVDDIFEIAMCSILDTRLMAAAKDDAGAIISVSRASGELNKRKQKAKENLASRRADRKSASLGQDINIVDLAARYDNKRRDVEMERVKKLLAAEETMAETLSDIIKEEIF